MHYLLHSALGRVQVYFPVSHTLLTNTEIFPYAENVWSKENQWQPELSCSCRLPRGLWKILNGVYLVLVLVQTSSSIDFYLPGICSPRSSSPFPASPRAPTPSACPVKGSPAFLCAPLRVTVCCVPVESLPPLKR